MGEQLTDAQRALKLAIAENFKAYTTLCDRLGITPNKVNRSHANQLSGTCSTSLESTREDALNAGLSSKATQDQEHINQLPPELLVKVFQFNIDIHTSSYVWRINNLPQGRLSQIILLSSVCSYWRKVAVETSLFWSQIPIQLPEALVALCVERANNRPLDIVATEPSWGTMTPSSDRWKGQNPLRAHVHDIYSLTVTARTQVRACSPIDWSLEPGIQWNLQELSVNYIGDYGLSPGLSMIESFPCIKLDRLAKGLCTLSLTGIRINWYQCAFEKLNTLKLNRVFLSLQELKQVLLASPMLQVLELINIHLPLGSRVNPGLLNLPNLRHLRLFELEIELNDIINVFGPGTYQVELDVGLGLFNTMPHAQMYMSSLQQAICKTRNVTILGSNYIGPIQGVSFSSIIATLPDLTTLRLRDMRLGLEPLSVLEHILQDSPQIKQLQLRNVDITDVERFKEVVENCSVNRIELVECCTRNSEKIRIRPGTPLYEWGLELAPKVAVS